ncbi:CusA/CzcA family heavy metal efflux RND transporter [Methylothermus subterraneus]
MLKALIEYCVHRRLAAVVTTAIVAGFGGYAFYQTPIEAYPDVTNTQVTVITLYPGYAPEEVERQITVPLERVLNGTPDVLQMRSQSLFGLSLITLTFEDGVDSFRSRTLISERLLGADLPEGVTPRLAPDYTPLGEIYKFVVTSDRHSLYELRSEMEWNIARILRQVPGVADVLTFGGYYKEIHVEVDPRQLEAFDLTLDEVNRAIAGANRNVGAGFLRHGDQQMLVRGVGLLASPEDIQRIVLKSQGGTPVTVADVARLVQSYTPRQGTVGLDEQKEVVQGIVLLRRGQNPSRVLDGIHAKVAELNQHILPAGMRIVPFLDRTELVHNTLHTVYENLFHGFLLVTGVVWLFLRSLRGSFIVAVVIPLALLVAFLGLYALGLPANLISMGAVDFGIILDGAVVLVERVIHQLQTHRPKAQKEIFHLVATAAVDVAKPTLYAMLIIIAALLPVFSLERVEGRIFRPLALTYSFALTGGLVFALTLVPALCAALIRPHHALVQEAAFLVPLRRLYRRTLAAALSKRAWTLGLALAALGVGLLGAGRLGTEFLPELDEGDAHVFVEMPASIALAKGQEILLEVRRRLLAFPEVKSVLSQQGRSEDGTDNEGVNMSETFIHLKPRDLWRPGISKEALVDAMREAVEAIPGVRFNFSQPIRDNVEEAVSGVRGKVVLKIYGQDLERMRATLEQAKRVLTSVAGVTDLALYRESLAPQLRIELNRTQLARYGMSVDAVQDTIETALAGKIVTEFWQEGWPVPVRVILPYAAREDFRAVGELSLPTATGARVPLREVARLKLESSRTSIEREAGLRFLALKFNFEGRDLGSVVQEAQRRVAAEVKVPENHYLVWSGEFENQQRAMAKLRIIVPLALLLILGLLYSALQSGRCTLAILLASPFALLGGVGLLYAFKIPLSVSAAIGFIALLGQISLLGLLVISAVEYYQRQGLAPREAILAGASERLRAVLMASLLAGMGLLPMALSTSIGSEVQRPFAVTIVGGMITTFLVAMYVLPVIYSYLAPKRLLFPEESDELEGGG